MKKLSITINEKRFLIVWMGICFFAFFVNITEMKGKIGEDFYLWTKGHNESDFYPFTKFFTEYYKDIPSLYNRALNLPLEKEYYTQFNGIFASFNLPELIFYSIMGLCVIFLPKLWK